MSFIGAAAVSYVPQQVVRPMVLVLIISSRNSRARDFKHVESPFSQE